MCLYATVNFLVGVWLYFVLVTAVLHGAPHFSGLSELGFALCLFFEGLWGVCSSLLTRSADGLRIRFLSPSSPFFSVFFYFFRRFLMFFGITLYLAHDVFVNRSFCSRPNFSCFIVMVVEFFSFLGASHSIYPTTINCCSLRKGRTLVPLFFEFRC